MRKVKQALFLRSVVAARAGNVAQAHEATMITVRLAQADLNEPLLVGLMAGVGGSVVTWCSIWELCDAHAGGVEDFARLEAALSALDYRQATLRVFRGEMAAGVDGMQYLGRRQSELISLLQLKEVEGGSGSSGSGWNLATRMIPNRYFDASAAALVDLEFNYKIKPLRDHGWNELIQSGHELETRINTVTRNVFKKPTYVLPAIYVISIGKSVCRVVYAQTRVNQAIIACALERYRIENGTYPQSLDAVKLWNGKPLPLEVFNYEPMGYLATSDGKYKLWSIGFDGVDDGGTRELDELDPNGTVFSAAGYIGDWVWDYAGADQ